MDQKETRVTSETGGAKGRKLARFDLIPQDSLQEIAEHFGKGAEKYAPNPETGLDNWRHGYPWSLSYGAMLRHASAALGGEDIDEETGSKHLAAVAWHAITLMHQMNTPGMREKFDDRQDRIQKGTACLSQTTSTTSRTAARETIISRVLKRLLGGNPRRS